MAPSKWLCTKNTKNMLVKIVHPGGQVELHDRPVLASEIMLRNPRSVVAHPHVFKQPWAIVPPDTMLMLGQKFYVVPTKTIRKLQRQAFRSSPSPLQDMQEHNTSTILKHSKGDVCFSNENCFPCLFVIKTKIINKGNGDDASGETGSSSSSRSSETKCLTKKRNISQDFTGEYSPKRLSSFDNWQPRLESIVEEPSTNTS
ncbi:hypothetical protein Tsubulata_006884 [Turnera subulata]|uniref:Uncharacterized protein n=1 Tax=Turnera subulata TaxID=218843 RepID=A0A9Q0JNX8_9ROSI|nr:hypothetical protein Tsubulata_006884 [Turnera subulata]